MTFAMYGLRARPTGANVLNIAPRGAALLAIDLCILWCLLRSPPLARTKSPLLLSLYARREQKHVQSFIWRRHLLKRLKIQ
jgi:hypothetical protein